MNLADARPLLRALFPRGPCGCCGAPQRGPACEPCRRRSGIGAGPRRGVLAGRRFYFVAAYHAAPTPSGRATTPVAQALSAFKDRGDRYAGRCLARLLALQCGPLAEGFDLVVPVPADPVRLRRRGHSPAAWFARALARQSGVAMTTTALRRCGARPPQRELRGPARRRNARGAFRLGRRALAGYSIVLVDDVATTGATLADASRRLHDGGARRVRCVVLACADNRIVTPCPFMIEPGGRTATGNAPR